MRDVVIIGAGFGGLRAARELLSAGKHSSLKITIIDKNPHHTLRPKLPEAIGGRIACAVQVPVESLVLQWQRMGLDAQFVHAAVTGVDTLNQQIITDKGKYPYWRLIVATGSESAAAPMTGGDVALPIWNFEDACNIRRRAEFGLRAAMSGKGMHWLNFVIIGGGFVGVEVSAELARRMQRLCRRENLDGAQPKITIVEMAPRLLSRSSPSVSRKVQRQLQALGVKFRLGHRAQEVTPEGVLLDNGEFLHAAHTLWAGGTRPMRSVAEWGLADAQGRIMVHPTLQSVQHPSIYALGDAAYISSQAGPTEPSAHVALEQGALVARNIKAEISGLPQKAYRHGSPIYAIATGPWQGVLSYPGAPAFTGPLIAIAKQFVLARHLVSLGGLHLLRTAMGATFTAACKTSAWDCRPVEDGLLQRT